MKLALFLLTFASPLLYAGSPNALIKNDASNSVAGRRIAAMNTGAEHWGSTDLDRGQGKYELTGAYFQSPIAGNKRENLIWQLGFRLEYLSFDIADSPTPLISDRELWNFGISTNFIWSSENSDWSPFLRASANLASDFENGIDSDALRLNIIGGTFLQANPKLKWLFGFMYQENFESLPLIPLIGFDWNLTDDLNLNLLGPRLNFIYTASDDLQIGLFTEGHSRNWNVDINGESRDFEVNSARLGFQASYRITPQIWLTGETGFSFGNSLEVLTTSGDSLYEEDADTSFFVRLGCRIPF